jgi:hypothetical protein
MYLSRPGRSPLLSAASLPHMKNKGRITVNVDLRSQESFNPSISSSGQLSFPSADDPKPDLKLEQHSPLDSAELGTVDGIVPEQQAQLTQPVATVNTFCLITPLRRPKQPYMHILATSPTRSRLCSLSWPYNFLRTSLRLVYGVRSNTLFCCTLNALPTR